MVAPGTVRRRRLVDILQRLPPTQRTQVDSVEPHVLPDFSLVRPSVLAQCPAYRLLQKEFPRSQRGFDAGVQQLEVRFRLESELANDRGAALPQIGRLAPVQHLAPHWRRIVLEDRTDAMRCDVV